MTRELPTGTVTFLFTDVEGSTKLLHELGTEAYASALAEHRRLIREACAREGGVEVDTQGDAFFFAFPTAPGALVAAQQATGALASGPIQVRIGLHTGAPLVIEEGYVGEDVHFAARVAASGHGGQILVSSITAALIEPSGSEPQALSLLDLGEHRLKDIPDAVSIFQLGDGQFPPLKTISNTNLPRPASSFVGREAELAEVLARGESGARLLTLTGPGGSGKTRLALEAAVSLVPEYKAGVFWVGLASLRDPALVAETISQTLGAKDGLREHIGERELLLLLDNLEQVIEAAPELTTLLSFCPNLTLLVTSRELLRVQGEVEYQVPPLAEPEAVSLFCERAQVDPSEEIAELCVRLDSLPLAVELAAARAKALSPAQILERLSQRLDLFKGGRDADPRQQTLRATIEWSYDLLSEEERQLFRRLSVFAGGCTLEAAEEVADADLDTLQSLVERSLVRFSNERYRMLETIREYASERLEVHDEAVRMRQRHVDFMLEVAEREEPHLEGADQASWLGRLEAERDNLRAALDHSANEGRHDELLRLAAACWPFWWLRGYWIEGRRWLEEGLEQSRHDGLVRLKALQGASFLAYLRQDLPMARRFANEHLALARQVDQPAEIAKALHALGNVSLGEGDRAEARVLYEESLSHLPDHPFARYPLHALGYFALVDGDAERACALLERSLAISEAEVDHAEAADTVGVLAFAALRRGDTVKAAEHLRRSIRLASELGDKPVIASRCLQGVAAVLARRGEAASAALLLGAADRIAHDIGSGLGQLGESMQQRTLEVVRRQLDEDLLNQLRLDGRAMSLEDAVEYALSSLD